MAVGFLAVLIEVCDVRGADDFFRIHKVRHVEPSRALLEKLEKTALTRKVEIPLGLVEAEVSARERVFLKDMFVRAHFFKGGKLVKTVSPVKSANLDGLKGISRPVLLAPGKRELFYFSIPKEAEGGSALDLLVVVGDEAGAAAKPLGHRNISTLEYPERPLVVGTEREMRNRKEVLDPVTEVTLKTGDTVQPQITLFLCAPPGLKSGEEIQGVLAICVLANGLDDLRKRLQSLESDVDYGGLFGFAKKHKLVILAWGAGMRWGARVDYGDEAKQAFQDRERRFDRVANVLRGAIMTGNRGFLHSG